MNHVVDRAGVLRYAKAAFDLDALNGILVPLLKEPPPEAEPQATPAAPASAPAASSPALASQPTQ